MKRNARAFALSFFCTLLAIFLLIGLLLADWQIRQTGYGSFAPFMQLVRQDALHYQLSLLGQEYQFSLEWLNTAADWLHTVSAWLPMRLRGLVWVLSL